MIAAFLAAVFRGCRAREKARMAPGPRGRARIETLSMSEPTTLVLQRCLDQLKQGDAAARAELLAHAQGRLERLVGKMLHGFPGVKRWVQDQDVLQNANVRLWQALQTRTPASVRDFFGLAAGLVRRELIDLLRHYFGPQGFGANHASHPSAADDAGALSGADSVRLQAWTRFHEAVEALPAAEREVFGLLWYHQIQQNEAASILGVEERTVRRWWRSARLLLHETLQGEVPAF